FFVFTSAATSAFSPLSLHDALPIYVAGTGHDRTGRRGVVIAAPGQHHQRSVAVRGMRHGDVGIACIAGGNLARGRIADKGRRDMAGVPEIVDAGATASHLQRRKDALLDEVVPAAARKVL